MPRNRVSRTDTRRERDWLAMSSATGDDVRTQQRSCERALAADADDAAADAAANDLPTPLPTPLPTRHPTPLPTPPDATRRHPTRLEGAAQVRRLAQPGALHATGQPGVPQRLGNQGRCGDWATRSASNWATGVRTGQPGGRNATGECSNWATRSRRNLGNGECATGQPGVPQPATGQPGAPHRAATGQPGAPQPDGVRRLGNQERRNHWQPGATIQGTAQPPAEEEGEEHSASVGAACSGRVVGLVVVKLALSSFLHFFYFSINSAWATAKTMAAKPSHRKMPQKQPASRATQ